jgi:hypothetical protein
VTRAVHLLVLGVLGVMLGALYVGAIELRDPAYSLGLHERIVAGEAGSPYRYRVLVPALLEAVTFGFARVEPRGDAFLHAMLVYACGGFVLQLVSLYVVCREWFSGVHALIAVLFVSGITLTTFSYFTYQPWSILEVSFMALGLLFASRGSWLAVGILVLLASLNRETGIFVPLAVFFGVLRQPLRQPGLVVRGVMSSRETRLAAALVLLSAGMFAALRLWRGGADQVDTLGDVILRNLQPEQLAAAGIALPLFLGLGWLYAALGFTVAPSFPRRAARVVPLYLAVFLVWGWWRETRILTTLYPLVLPLILAYCYPPRTLLAGDRSPPT